MRKLLVPLLLVLVFIGAQCAQPSKKTPVNTNASDDQRVFGGPHVNAPEQPPAPPMPEQPPTPPPPPPTPTNAPPPAPPSPAPPVEILRGPSATPPIPAIPLVPPKPPATPKPASKPAPPPAPALVPLVSTISSRSDQKWSEEPGGFVFHDQRSSITASGHFKEHLLFGFGSIDNRTFVINDGNAEWTFSLHEFDQCGERTETGSGTVALRSSSSNTAAVTVQNDGSYHGWLTIHVPTVATRNSWTCDTAPDDVGLQDRALQIELDGTTTNQLRLTRTQSGNIGHDPDFGYGQGSWQRSWDIVLPSPTNTPKL